MLAIYATAPLCWSAGKQPRVKDWMWVAVDFSRRALCRI